MKGIIIEKGKNYFIVLTPSGEYKRIGSPTKKEIGERLEIKDSPFSIKHVVAAAVFLLVLLSMEVFSVFFSPPKVFAYVTIDINPGVEFAIDTRNKVLNASPSNRDGELVLERIKYKGREIDTVLKNFTKSAIEMGYISSSKQNNILISIIGEEELDEAYIQEELEKLEECQSAILADENQNAQIAVVVLDKEIREEAKKAGVSAGKLEAFRRIRQGEDAPEKVRGKKIGDLLREKNIELKDVFPGAKVQGKANSDNARNKEEKGEKKVKGKTDSSQTSKNKNSLKPKKDEIGGNKDNLVREKESPEKQKKRDEPSSKQINEKTQKIDETNRQDKNTNHKKEEKKPAPYVEPGSPDSQGENSKSDNRENGKGKAESDREKTGKGGGDKPKPSEEK